MDDIDDLPLDPEPGPPSAGPEPRPLWPWIAALVIVSLATAVFVYVRRPAPTPPVAAVSDTQPATPAPAARPVAAGPLGPTDVAAIDLPPLAESDAAVRALVQAVSSHPSVLTWLATDGLLRNLAVCIDNAADGKSPARHLRTLAPRERFRTTMAGQRMVTDPSAFKRYDTLAAAVGGLDMAAVARLYVNVRPRLDEAYQELGHGPGEVDADVRSIVEQLLATPDVPADAALKAAVRSYRYADEDLESLSGLQKQVLRMGPDHVGVVRAKVRELAAALGITRAQRP